jgi:hypothetical protein
MQELEYFVNLRWPKTNPLKLSRNEPPNSTAITAHRYTVKSLSEARSVSFTAHFSPEQHTPSFPNTILKKNIKDWNGYWKDGGFVDLTSSSNPNATELQRRIVQSQYHVRVNSAAKGQSPQESGLMNNGWYGKSICRIIIIMEILTVHRQISHGNADLAQCSLGNMGQAEVLRRHLPGAL